MKNESTIQAEVRAEFSARGGIIWRNNSGVLPSADGRPVRFGLGNDSSKINKVMKSADLVGIVPVVILPEHVGLTFGVFAAIECKAQGWKYTGKGREVAQMNFLTKVTSLGGIGGFCNDSSKIFE